MPLYPYHCTKCGNRFEKIQSFTDEPLKECPKCGGALERPLTAPGLQFKGAGWYVTDYAPKGGSSSSKPDAAEAKKPADSKTDSPATAPPAAAPASTPASTSTETKK